MRLALSFSATDGRKRTTDCGMSSGGRGDAVAMQGGRDHL